MDIKELAAYLNVKISWIYEQLRLRKTNGFPVLKAGKYLRFDRQKVIEWMAGNDD
jgi:excisionase family DNA binding protein